MDKVLFFCDVDGVVAPIPYVEALESRVNISDVEYALGKRQPRIRKEADPEKYFVLDQKFTGDFVQWHEPSVKTRPITIEYSTELIARLKKVSENPKVDFRWCTMWNMNAVNLLNPIFGFDVPNIQVQDHSSEMYRWFKSYAIFDMLKESDVKNMVWVDDTHNIPFVNHPFEESGFHSEVFAKDYDVNALVISPNTLWGISRDEMSTIEKFIEKI